MSRIACSSGNAPELSAAPSSRSSAASTSRLIETRRRRAKTLSSARSSLDTVTFSWQSGIALIGLAPLSWRAPTAPHITNLLWKTKKGTRPSDYSATTERLFCDY